VTAPKKIKYKRVRVGDMETITATYQGEILGPIDSSHPAWETIIAKLKADDVSVVNLFQPIKEIALGFHELSDRLVVRDRHVYWDGDRVDNSLTEQIIRFMEEGLDFKPLVKFYDKISQNPSTNSQRLLYNWLRTHRFTITPEGDILGFKGYRKKNGMLHSTHAGTASVNGQEFIQQTIPCKVGDTVTMARSSVVDNPAADCSAGLHVGTPSYARQFGDIRMAVLINPRDVVSVPNREGQKMRVCRYYVMGPYTDQKIGALIKEAPEWEPRTPATEASEPAEVPKPELTRPSRTRPADQPKSSVLEDEKMVTKPASKAVPRATAPKKATAGTRPKAAKTAANAPAAVTPKSGPRRGSIMSGSKTTPKTEPAKAATTRIDWTTKNLGKLLAAKNDAELLKAFPGANLSTLKRRAAQERKQRAGKLPPPTV
jgi:hypothetical protein